MLFMTRAEQRAYLAELKPYVVASVALFSVGTGAGLVILAAYSLAPFYWMVVSSLRGPADILSNDLIPESVLEKAPSAELRPGQRDSDSLPPYEVLDPIVEAYVEDDLTVEDLIQRGHDPDLVRRVARMIDIAEWKRRQAPIGVRVTAKAFGRDRRMPITNQYPG